MGVGQNITDTWKITENILFSQMSGKLNACIDSVYQAFLLECLGTRLTLVIICYVTITVAETVLP